jgi:hypothetical protein
METTKRILFNKFQKAEDKTAWLDYIKTVSEEWYNELFSWYLKKSFRDAPVTFVASQQANING